jgi:hypothetical protein
MVSTMSELQATERLNIRLEHLISEVPCELCGGLLCGAVAGETAWIGSPAGPRTHDACLERAR